MHKESISMRQFAKLAGVSTATVSRVFSQPSKVANDKKGKVMKLAKQTGFRPSPIARAAFGQRTKSIGILLPSLSSSYFAKVSEGIQATLLKEDYLPIIMSAMESSEIAIRRMMDHRVDGLIIGFSDEQIDLGHVFGSRIPGIPIVAIEQPRRGIICDLVLNDDLGGGRQAAEYLIELGHKRFGFCYYGEGHSNCDFRLQGFKEVMTEAGIVFQEENIARMFHHRKDREELFHQTLKIILSKKDRPTAFFAPSDCYALRIYKASKELNLKIPLDLSIVGFADLDFSEFIDPPLSTIAQKPSELGTEAATLILRRLNNEYCKNKTVTIPTNLIKRESCAPPQF